ncbi:HEAT repeat domain-containing protein [candidate division KSB1 bacterium]|nr:HEAT repeat domain-containing protein [candidate division KSB1 bacterium]
MNDCKKFRQMMWLSVYEELSLNEQEALNNHLERCKNCQFEYSQVKKTVDAYYRIQPVQASQKVLESFRQALHQRLLNERARKARPSWISGLSEILQYHKSLVFQVSTSMAIFILGIFLGRYILSDTQHVPTEPTDMSFKNTIGIDYIDIDPTTRNIRIAYNSVQSETIEGNINDLPIQQLLMETLTTSAHPNIRLKSVRALSRVTSYNQELFNSLVDVVNNDENSGIRLKAIKLINSFPASSIDTEDQISFYVSTILKEQNSSIRNEAINGLSMISNQESRNLLTNLAQHDDDEYLRYKSGRMKFQRVMNEEENIE